MGARIGQVATGALLLATWFLVAHRGSGAPPSPPTASPPPPLRLSFAVRRRNRRIARKNERLSQSRLPSLDSAPPIPTAAGTGAQPPPPPPPSAASAASDASKKVGFGLIDAVNAVCGIDGKQAGAGCHGHPCLLGQCFCGDGSGGEACERGGRSRTCHAAEQAAYGPLANGLTRHATHDVCAFYEPVYGILRVDERRWRAAQQWEAVLWAAAPPSQTTDRNVHHSRHFSQYAALPDALGDVVEFGCGPFTQTQSLLRPTSTALSITLIDPLAHRYMEATKGCTFRDQRLGSRPVRVLSVVAESLHLFGVAVSGVR